MLGAGALVDGEPLAFLGAKALANFMKKLLVVKQALRAQLLANFPTTLADVRFFT